MSDKNGPTKMQDGFPPYSFPFKPWPLNWLYIAWRVSSGLLVLLPYWVVTNLHSSWRPRESWSLLKVICAKTIRRYWETVAAVGMPPPSAHRHKHVEVARGAEWIPAAPSKYVVGSIAEKAALNQVQPIDIPAHWFGPKPSHKPIVDASTERIVLNFHGGAYVMNSAHTTDVTSNIPKGFSKWGGAKAKEGEKTVIHRILSVEYRLVATDPFPHQGQFPASILDALSAYIYVLGLGFKPSNIILAGDSAGANLVLGFTRYLIDAKLDDVPVPSGGLVLFSPWADVACSHDQVGMSKYTNWDSDYIGAASVTNYSIRALMGDMSPDEAKYNLYLSPSSLHLSAEDEKKVFDAKTWPRTYIVSGDAEVLLDEIRTLAQRMKNCGVDVTYDEVKDAIHDFVIFPWHRPERPNTFKKIVNWIEQA